MAEMTRLSFPAICFAALSALAVAGDVPERELVSIKIQRADGGLLAIVDGRLAFVQSHSRDVEPDGTTEASAVSYYFRRVGRTIQAVTIWQDQALSAEQAAVHLWYLSVDYAADPPVLMLTKRPDKYSEWVFESYNGKPWTPYRNWLQYVRNVNDLDKPAYLTLSGAGTTVRHNKNTVRLLDASPSEKKVAFEIQPLGGDGGK